MSLNKVAKEYINNHISIKDCLKKGIINYSALARKIADELKIDEKNFSALLVACRRYANSMNYVEQEKKIINILKNSELEIKNKIVVAIIDKRINPEKILELQKKADVFYLIEGTKVYTVITSEKHLGELKKFEKNIIKLSKDLAMIILKSPEQVETTSGVMSFLFSLFGEQGVNIVETMSCWTDTILIISEKDIPKTINFLKF